MKTLIIHRVTFLFILMLGWMTAQGQQQWEVPGDNFSLEGALEIFKKSASPEEFERMLNDPEARVNNLDLNGDGYIDYIRVIDMYEGNVHAFVLQAAISENQSQDIAVITLEKLADGRAILQITGDADIYGVETIIEPTTEVRTYAGVNRSRVYVNVWGWPMVRYVYGPYYRVWVSPWTWSYRPYWWRPWRPVIYYDYYTFWNPYRTYYSICYTHRVLYAHRIYRPYRTTSVIVYNKHHHNIRAYRSKYIDREGHYQTRESSYHSRQANTVRYNSSGRIVSNTNEQVRSRSAARNSIYQEQLTVRRESGNRVQSSNANNQRYSDSYNARRSIERPSDDAYLRRSERNSNAQQSAGRISGNSNLRMSSGNANMQRSDAARSNNGANYRRSDGSTNVQRSSDRSNRNVNVQSSQPRSSSKPVSHYSSGSANGRKSYGSTSRNSGSRVSSGNSNISRSTGSRSSFQKSSPSRSGGSNSRQSEKSNRSSRGGH